MMMMMMMMMMTDRLTDTDTQQIPILAYHRPDDETDMKSYGTWLLNADSSSLFEYLDSFTRTTSAFSMTSNVPTSTELIISDCRSCSALCVSDSTPVLMTNRTFCQTKN